MLPEGIRAAAGLSVQHCSSFSKMPASFRCLGLQLQDLPLLEGLDLPSGFSGGLDVQGCPRVRKLQIPGNQLEHIVLDRCSVVGLPEGLCAEHYLVLDELPLLEMPKGLQVGGVCKLRNLWQCTSIGGGTHIAGDLNLHGLPRLRVIPNDLRVDGHIVVDEGFDREILPLHLRDRTVVEAGDVP